RGFTVGRYLFQRLGAAAFNLFTAVTVVFLIMRVLPGDPTFAILGDDAAPEAIQALRDRLGLDRPLLTQYVEYLTNMLRGDLGRSLVSNEPVGSQIRYALPYTIDLTIAAMVISIVLGLPAGVWAAAK